MCVKAFSRQGFLRCTLLANALGLYREYTMQEEIWTKGQGNSLPPSPCTTRGGGGVGVSVGGGGVPMGGGIHGGRVNQRSSHSWNTICSNTTSHPFLFAHQDWLPFIYKTVIHYTFRYVFMEKTSKQSNITAKRIKQRKCRLSQCYPWHTNSETRIPKQHISLNNVQ